MKRVDALVVGAGLAGLETALQLARGGHSVLLAERRAAVDRAIRTTGIFVRRTLEDFDLPEPCLGPAVHDVVLYSPGGRSLALRSPRVEFRVGRMAELYRTRLAECRDAGVEWAPSTRLISATATAGGSLCTLARHGRPRQLAARLVIGADGAESRVAAALGLERNRALLVGVEEVFRLRQQVTPCFHCWLDPRVAPGYLAWVVADGEELHLGVGGYPDRFQPAAALREFRLRVQARFGLAGRAPDERRGGLIPVGGVLRRIACERGLLVGDAAGAVSPLTAGGLDPCLRLSRFAARIARDYLASGAAAGLRAYSGAAFRRKFARRLLLRRMLAGVRSPLAAEAAIALLRTPLLRPLAEKVFFGRGSFPDTGDEPPGPRLSSPVSTELSAA